MGAFQNARKVEARSLVALGPFLEDMGSRYVLTDKGKLGRFLQETCGDLLFNDRGGRLWGVELKAEERHTGNLFLETWSNRNLEDEGSHGDRGSNAGWLFKTRADLLFYHFLDADALYIVNMFRLQRWCFRTPTKRLSERAGACRPEPCLGRVWDFPPKRQSKYDQLNDTWGRIVPVRVLEREMEVPPRRFSPSQLRLQLFSDLASA